MGHTENQKNHKKSSTRGRGKRERERETMHKERNRQPQVWDRVTYFNTVAALAEKPQTNPWILDKLGRVVRSQPPHHILLPLDPIPDSGKFPPWTRTGSDLPYSRSPQGNASCRCVQGASTSYKTPKIFHITQSGGENIGEPV